jgi:hypothetical protein
LNLPDSQVCPIHRSPPALENYIGDGERPAFTSDLPSFIGKVLTHVMPVGAALGIVSKMQLTAMGNSIADGSGEVEDRGPMPLLAETLPHPRLMPFKKIYKYWRDWKPSNAIEATS